MGPIGLAILVVVILIGVVFTTVAAAVRARADGNRLFALTASIIVVGSILAWTTLGAIWTLTFAPGMALAAATLESQARRNTAGRSLTALMAYLLASVPATMWVIGS